MKTEITFELGYTNHGGIEELNVGYLGTSLMITYMISRSAEIWRAYKKKKSNDDTQCKGS